MNGDIAKCAIDRWLLGFFCALTAPAGSALAADLPPVPSAPTIEATTVSGWTYRITPYGWLTAITGTQTVRGRSVKVDASFIDIVEKSDSLLALMGNVEARNGPFAIYGDLVWSRIGVEGSNVRSRTPAPGVSATIGTSVNLDITMAIAEVGVAYEVARSGPVALDILGGARYWYQEADLSFNIAGAARRWRSAGNRRPRVRPLGICRLARSGDRRTCPVCGFARARTLPARRYRRFWRWQQILLASHRRLPIRLGSYNGITSRA